MTDHDDSTRPPYASAAEAEAEAALERLAAMGLDTSTAAHVMIAAGLYHMAEHLDPADLLRELGVVREWIDGRIGDTKTELN